MNNPTIFIDLDGNNPDKKKFIDNVVDLFAKTTNTIYTTLVLTGRGATETAQSLEPVANISGAINKDVELYHWAQNADLNIVYANYRAFIDLNKREPSKEELDTYMSCGFELNYYGKHYVNKGLDAIRIASGTSLWEKIFGTPKPKYMENDAQFTKWYKEIYQPQPTGEVLGTYTYVEEGKTSGQGK